MDRTSYATDEPKTPLPPASAGCVLTSPSSRMPYGIFLLRRKEERKWQERLPKKESLPVCLFRHMGSGMYRATLRKTDRKGCPASPVPRFSRSPDGHGRQMPARRKALNSKEFMSPANATSGSMSHAGMKRDRLLWCRSRISRSVSGKEESSTLPFSQNGYPFRPLRASCAACGASSAWPFPAPGRDNRRPGARHRP